MPFIFSRRFVQKCLNTLRTVISDKEHTDLVAKLNERKPDRLAAMWEAVVLAAFAKEPGFVHEAPLENGRRPDFQFDLPMSNIRVVGDVTCVSDKGPKADNPAKAFIAEIDRIAHKHGSDISQFEVYVNSENAGEYNKRKVILKLPKGQTRQRFLKTQLTPYVIERLSREDYGHKQSFKTEDYDVDVTFRPKSQFSSYGHLSFTDTLHIDRNPVWNALKAKADQLRGAPSGTLRVLVLCDGGSEAMRERNVGQSIGCKEIVQEFLRRNTGIDLVVTMTVGDQIHQLGISESVHKWGWHVKEAWMHANKNNSKVAIEFQAVIKTFWNILPNPTSNAASAVENCLNMDYGIGGWGGYKLAGNTLTISARALQRVLAGEVTVEEFDRDHEWPTGNRFAAELRNGRTISIMSVVTSNDAKDDDQIEITFAEDAALSMFN